MYSFPRESRGERYARKESRMHFYFSGADFMNSLMRFNRRALVLITCR